MTVVSYLSRSELHQIVRYQGETHDNAGVRYRGSVRPHPYDAGKFLLITSPMDDPAHFYEFRKRDVIRFGEPQGMVSEHGETLELVDVLVRRGSFGIEMRPFQVG